MEQSKLVLRGKPASEAPAFDNIFSPCPTTGQSKTSFQAETPSLQRSYATLSNHSKVVNLYLNNERYRSKFGSLLDVAIAFRVTTMPRCTLKL